jgi:CDP-paratose 2-epimerase
MSGKVLITGGAGFIGCNLAAHLARSGRQVRIYDDLSRPGVDRNLAWLQRSYGNKIETRIADLLDRPKLRDALAGVEAVFHLAAQVAVTTSITDPMHDFDVNARGTLEVLEAVRALKVKPAVVFASTTKVYGCLPDVALRDDGVRWTPADAELAGHGIGERRPLEFRTPYAGSKGCADQYVLGYAHSYGIPATVFRTSSVYGPHQFGTEDHGWVAHFVSRAVEGRPITIYGDGKQVRDVLFIDDLVDAFTRAWSRIGICAGKAFNVGGGVASAISLRELVRMIEALRGKAPEVRYASWRPGDQRYFVSSSAAFNAATGWYPRVRPSAGIEALHGWIAEERAPVIEEARRG